MRAILPLVLRTNLARALMRFFRQRRLMRNVEIRFVAFDTPNGSRQVQPSQPRFRPTETESKQCRVQRLKPQLNYVSPLPAPATSLSELPSFWLRPLSRYPKPVLSEQNRLRSLQPR